MARLLVACLQRGGYKVDIASQLRAFLRNPHSESDKASLIKQASVEVERLSDLWQKQGAPRLWFCYHPYFKSPDLIGPALCARFSVPYVTAEASYSARRRQGIWASMQEQVLATIESAAVNICFTQRDRRGLRDASASAELTTLKPFIDTSIFARGAMIDRAGRDGTVRLITVAMMRPGDKFESYRRLSTALSQILNLPWSLSLIGDGVAYEPVKELFKVIPSERIEWLGLLQPEAIADVFCSSDLYVWPGCGEAYGLAYLEAQAAGLPVVAFNTAGVPEVVNDGYSGILTPLNNDTAFAEAVARLLSDAPLRQRMSNNAVLQVKSYHSDDSATVELQRILHTHTGL